MSVERVAMISMHTSPVSPPGTGDAGGLNVSILSLAAELAIRGVEVDLVSRAAGTPSSRQLLPGVTVHELEAGPAGPIPKRRLPAVADEFGEAVAQLTRRAPFTVMHAHYWLSGLAVLPVAIELDLPLVQSFHTLAAMKNALGMDGAAPEPEQRLRSESFIANQADALIAASSAEATALIDSVHAPPDRTWIVPPGVDLALFAPRTEFSHTATREALALDPERQLIVIAGRVQPLKGHDLAIRALAELRASGAPLPQLVIAGEATPGDEGYLAALHALASQTGVAPHVRYVGALTRDGLADLLSAASLTLVPSFSETFGLVALESAAAGTPVIAYRTSGLAESVSDGVSGLLLGTREPRYWASEIALLLADAERLSALATTARAFAERFPWSAAAESLLGVYGTVQR